MFKVKASGRVTSNHSNTQNTQHNEYKTAGDDDEEEEHVTRLVSLLTECLTMIQLERKQRMLQTTVNLIVSTHPRRRSAFSVRASFLFAWGYDRKCDSPLKSRLSASL
jgi:formyltetrahydrofolate hydrolase